MNWYLKALKNYAVFDGRARRKEYWFFVLINIVFLVVAMILDNLLGIAFKDVGYGPIYLLYSLAVLIPSLAVTIRRLHDTGKSGWYIFLGLIPFVGGLILFVFMVIGGDTGENEYGADPKETESSLFPA